MQIVSQRANCYQRQYIWNQAKRSSRSIGSEWCRKIHYLFYPYYGIFSLRWHCLSFRTGCDRFRCLTIGQQNGTLRIEQSSMGKADSGRAYEYDWKDQGAQQVRYWFPEGTYQTNTGSQSVQQQTGRVAEWRQQEETLLRDITPGEPSSRIFRWAHYRSRPDLSP